MNPSEQSTSSNLPSKIVQFLLFAAGIAWAFLVSKQDLSETQIPGFFIALSISWWLTPKIRAIAVRRDLVDKPDKPGEGRRIHTEAVPRLGGVAIYIGMVLTIIALIAICGRLPQVARGSEGGYIGIAVGGTLIFALGLIDDIKSIPAKLKLLFQIIAGCASYSLGVRIKSIPVPDYIASCLHLSLPNHSIDLGLCAIPVTVLWLIAITNAVNLIDGMDGLAAGVSAISALTIWSVALGEHIDRPYAALVAAMLAGALFGFLRWNFHPARIFLGDSGAYLTGFILAALSITGVLKGATTATLIVPTFSIALLILSFPLADTSWAVIRRTAQGRSIFAPDAGHIHHRLLQKGLSQKKVAYRIYGLTGFFGFVAACFVGQQVYYSMLVGAVLLMAVFFTAVLNRHQQHRSDILPGEVPALAETEAKTEAASAEPPRDVHPANPAEDRHSNVTPGAVGGSPSAENGDNVA